MFQVLNLFCRHVDQNISKYLNVLKSTSGKKIDVGILGVPFKLGQVKDGVNDGPKAMRAGNLIGDLKRITGISDVKDYGDVKYIAEPVGQEVEKFYKCSSLADVAAVNKSLSSKVREIINNNRLCVTIGGDHSIAVGSIDGHVAAVGKKKVCVLWVDAHADINTPTTSGSGNMHGMPLSLLMEETKSYWPEDIPALDWQIPCIGVDDIAYIGLRDVDQWEKWLIDQFKITAFDMSQVDVYGIDKVIQMALAKIDPNNDKSIHVSFDIDAIDSIEAPSTGTAVRGGLTLREGMRVMEAAHNTGRLQVVDLVEVNPKIGSDADVKLTVSAAKELIKSACGRRRGGVPPIADNMPGH